MVLATHPDTLDSVPFVMALVKLPLKARVLGELLVKYGQVS